MHLTASEVIGARVRKSPSEQTGASRASTGADLENAVADGPGLGGVHGHVLEAIPAQRAEEDVGDNGEPQPELIVGERSSAETIGEEAELLLLGAVLHVSAHAVEPVEIRACPDYALCSPVAPLDTAPFESHHW